MRAIKTLSLATVGVVALALAGPASAQVGGGNELPSSATQPSGAGGTAAKPENNGIAAPGTSTGTSGSSATTGTAPMSGTGSGAGTR